ncbi:DUF5999 family protein [Streptomyces clavifer]
MPPCPPATASDGEAARVVTGGETQGWNRLCNGIVRFEDTGAILPDGRVLTPHRTH